ncbi:MAG: hypothetical protein PHG58_11800 [Clostridia bacterium]|nr:hypothetical protein [Clostridia bacterium]
MNRKLIAASIILVFLLWISSCSTPAPSVETHSFLTHMDDLKAINMAAKYLKEQGETVSFQETYIEYHDAASTTAHIPLEDGKIVEYQGEYLEIRLYRKDESKPNPYEYCTVVYITQEGKILGQNTLSSELPIQENVDIND